VRQDRILHADAATVMCLISTVMPWRARWRRMLVPVISPLLSRSPVTTTMSIDLARAGKGSESAMARAAGRLPSQQMMMRSSFRPAVRMGHDDQRTARSEQGAFDHELFGGALLMPCLPDYRDVEATGRASEQIGRARRGWRRPCVPRPRRPPLWWCSQASDRLLGGGGVLAALGFDEVGRMRRAHCGDDGS